MCFCKIYESDVNGSCVSGLLILTGPQSRIYLPPPRNRVPGGERLCGHPLWGVLGDEAVFSGRGDVRNRTWGRPFI
ncbi:hypothetical protein GCM10027162_59260 [Streptomyces incanus]